MIQLVEDDCLEYLKQCSYVRAIFADPPDNLGLTYSDDETRDRLPASVYYGQIELMLLRAIPKCDVLWLSHHHTHELEVGHIVREILRTRHPMLSWRYFHWVHSFSQYDDKDCAVGHRPILRLMKPNVVLDPTLIREESERMRLGDARAAGPRVPDTVLRYPRVVGNAAERRSWHPTQHPEQLIRRLMLHSCNKTETWLDIYAGTGTSLRVARKIGYNAIGVEKSPQYCEKIRAELRLSTLDAV